MRSMGKVAVLGLLGLGLTGCMWLLPPLQAVLTANVTSGPAPLTVTFSAAGSVGTVVSFTLDFQTDGIVDFEGANIAAGVSHTYPAPGAHIATLVVRDDRGRTDTTTLTITVTAPPPPPPTATLTATPPTLGPRPLTVEFVVGGTNVVRWVLFSGDGGVIAGDSVPQTRSYTFLGVAGQTMSYRAQLWVYDSLDREATDSVDIIVTP